MAPFNLVSSSLLFDILSFKLFKNEDTVCCPPHNTPSVLHLTRFFCQINHFPFLVLLPYTICKLHLPSRPRRSMSLFERHMCPIPSFLCTSCFCSNHVCRLCMAVSLNRRVTFKSKPVPCSSCWPVIKHCASHVRHLNECFAWTALIL